MQAQANIDTVSVMPPLPHFFLLLTWREDSGVKFRNMVAAEWKKGANMLCILYFTTSLLYF